MDWRHKCRSFNSSVLSPEPRTVYLPTVRGNVSHQGFLSTFSLPRLIFRLMVDGTYTVSTTDHYLLTLGPPVVSNPLVCKILSFVRTTGPKNRSNLFLPVSFIKSFTISTRVSFPCLPPCLSSGSLPPPSVTSLRKCSAPYGSYDRWDPHPSWTLCGRQSQRSSLTGK